MNRGKRSIAIDLAATQSRPLVEALVAWADVLVENFRRGVSGRLALDCVPARAINPPLI